MNNELIDISEIKDFEEKSKNDLSYTFPKYQYKIFIKDNGIGFDMKYSNKLFNVFERLHNKEDFEGSGIGLSIIKRIMERHDGSVSITSQLNIGTCLSLKFPKY